MRDQAQGIRDTIEQNTNVTILVGLFLLISALVVLGAPGLIGRSMMGILGLIVSSAGLVKLFVAYKAGLGWRALLAGSLVLLAGIALIFQTQVAMMSITVILVVYFLLSGVFEFFLAFDLRPLPGWLIVLVSAFVSIICALLLLLGMPLAGVWAIGIYVGVQLLLASISMLVLGLTAKNRRADVV